MPDEIPIGLGKYVLASTGGNLESPDLQTVRQISEIYVDNNLSPQEQDAQVIQTIVNTKLGIPSEQKPILKREDFIESFEKKSETLVRAKNWIEKNQAMLPEMTRADIWKELTSTIFENKEYDEVCIEYGENFVQKIQIGCAKFISDTDFFKNQKDTILKNPRSFVEKSFSSYFEGKSMNHEPKVTLSPFGVICYLHEDDFKKITDGKGGYMRLLPDNPEFAKKIIIINVQEAEPLSAQEADTDRTLEHEIKHAIYDNFFRVNEIEQALQVIVADTFIGEESYHMRNSLIAFRSYLEDDKNESISYHSKYSDMYASDDEGSEKLYEKYIEIMERKIRASDLTPDTQERLIGIYHQDFSNYRKQRKDLQDSIDLLYHAGIEEIDIPHETVDTMIQMIPVTKVHKLVKVLLNIKSNQSLKEQIRWYQQKPVREAREASDKLQKLYRLIRETYEGETLE